MNIEITSTLDSSCKEIVWEKNIIRIPFNTDDERDSKIYEIINILQKKIEKLEKNKDELCYLIINKEEAKSLIISHLKFLKVDGKEKVNIFEIS